MNGKFILMSKANKMQSQQHKFQTLCKAPGQTFNSLYDQRKWLKTHGRSHFINFSDEALLRLRKYFDSLDEKNSGSLGLQELEDPFIAFGLSQNRQEVENLIKSVDLDGSGKIEFDEFLQIMLKIKRGHSNSKVKNSAVYDFFQRLSNGKLGEEYNKDVSFRVNVSQYRRKQLLDSMLSASKQNKQKSSVIMENFRNQVMNNAQLRQLLYESKKSNIYMYGFDKQKFY